MLEKWGAVSRLLTAVFRLAPPRPRDPLTRHSFYRRVKLSLPSTSSRCASLWNQELGEAQAVGANFAEASLRRPNTDRAPSPLAEFPRLQVISELSGVCGVDAVDAVRAMLFNEARGASPAPI